MGSPDYTTEHQKGKHLTYEDYVKIQVRLQDGWSANRIAVKELHCSPNTVRKIIRQGMTPLYHGKVQRFKAKWLGKFTKRIAAAAVVHTRPKRKRRFFPCWVSVKQFSKNDTATACQDWLRSTRLGRGSIKSHVRTVKVLGMGLFAFQERIHLWKGVTH